jgi:hypothetical protein
MCCEFCEPGPPNLIPLSPKAPFELESLPLVLARKSIIGPTTPICDRRVRGSRKTEAPSKYLPSSSPLFNSLPLTSAVHSSREKDNALLTAHLPLFQSFFNSPPPFLPDPLPKSSRLPRREDVHSPRVGDEGAEPEGVGVDRDLEGEDAREEDVQRPQGLAGWRRSGSKE